MTIHNRHDFHAFSAFRRTDFRPTAFGHRKGRVDEALLFIERAALSKLVGDIHQDLAQNLIAAPCLKPAMNGFVVWITLRQHVPLGTRVQNPQHRFQNQPRGNGLAARTAVRNVLFGKMIPDPFPFRIMQANHSAFIADQIAYVILR